VQTRGSDFWTLHPSSVFEAGVANLAVSDAPDVTLQMENHTRALQVVATGELAWETAGEDIENTKRAITAANEDIATNDAEIDRAEQELSRARRRLDDIANDVESGHGYFGDSTLEVNGHTTVDIHGLPLDGRVLSGTTSGVLPEASGRSEETGGVTRLALIWDTDGGVLDGDRIYDRAVGPMQFIPSTWRLFTPDGNGDGQSDPQNVYDAALAAARYLCDAPGSMLTHEGEQRAYFAYNHDLEYSRNVTRTGRRYHELLDVSPESSAFAAHALTPTPEEQVAIDLAEAAAAAKDEFVDAAADEAVAAATAECEARTAADPDAEAAPVDPDAPVELTLVDSDGEEPPKEAAENAATVSDECAAVGESVRQAAKEAAALAYVAEPPENE